MHSFYNKNYNDLYINLVSLSRDMFFYKKAKLKDSMETRIFIIFILFSLILIIFKKKKIKFNQKIFDNIFTNIEYHLREKGMGDVTVNKKMKDLTKYFYDILLKIQNKNSNNFQCNEEVLVKYLFDNKESDLKLTSILNGYFSNFFNFCFEIDTNIVIRGKINFNN